METGVDWLDVLLGSVLSYMVVLVIAAVSATVNVTDCGHDCVCVCGCGCEMQGE